MLKPGKIACLLLIAALLMSSLPVSRGQGRAIEFTQEDVFSMHGWNSADLTVLGFKLGMTREEVAIAASALKAKSGFSTVGQPDRPLVVYCPPSWGTTGLMLYFDSADRVQFIVLDWGEHHQPVIGGFRGQTRQLINHYSEALIERLLGPPDSGDPPDLEERNPCDHYFRYNKLGIVIHAEVVSGPPCGDKPQPNQRYALAEIVFSAPSHQAGASR
jgi:hypothetical protein